MTPWPSLKSSNRPASFLHVLRESLLNPRGTASWENGKVPDISQSTGQSCHWPSWKCKWCQGCLLRHLHRAILTSDPVQVGGRAGYWAVACKLCLALQSFGALLSSTPCLGPLLGIKVTSAGCQDPMTTPGSLLNFPWLRPWNFSSHYPLLLCLPEA